MEARLLHFSRQNYIWTLLHSIDKAIPLLSYHVPGEPTSILDIHDYTQEVLVALQSAMEHHVRFGW